MCGAECEKALKDAVKTQKLGGKKGCEIVVEPYSRGDIFSIALAASVLKRRDPNAYMLIVPATLDIKKADEKWEQAITRAYRVAAEDLVAVVAGEKQIGSKPRDLLRPSRQIKGIVGAQHVSNFVCSPTQAQAVRYQSLGFLFSSGIVLARATTMLAQMSNVAKTSDSLECQGIDRIVETANFLVSVGDSNWYTNEARDVIASLPLTTLAKSVLSNSDDIAVIPTSLEFFELKNLLDIDLVMPQNSQQNRLSENALALDSTNTTIYGDSKLTIALGCSDTMVLHTQDAILVANKDSLDSVSQVISALSRIDAPELEKTSVSTDSWGSSRVLFETDLCCVRIINIIPGGKIGEHIPKKYREERWMLLDGRVMIHTSTTRKHLKIGEYFYIGSNKARSLTDQSENGSTLLVVGFTDAKDKTTTEI